MVPTHQGLRSVNTTGDEGRGPLQRPPRTGCLGPGGGLDGPSGVGRVVTGRVGWDVLFHDAYDMHTRETALVLLELGMRRTAEDL